MSDEEAKKIKLRYLRQQMKPHIENKKYWDDWLLMSTDKNLNSLLYQLIAITQKDIDVYQKQINFLKAPPQSNNKVIDLDQIRAIPIKDVLNSLGMHEHRTGWYLCPSHTENTGSMHIVPNKNYCHCFGCGVNLSTIDLVMAVDKCDVSTAIKRLKQYI